MCSIEMCVGTSCSGVAETRCGYRERDEVLPGRRRVLLARKERVLLARKERVLEGSRCE